MSERASLTVGTEPPGTEHDTLATWIFELESAAAIRDGMLSALVPDVRLLKSSVEASDGSSSTTQARACDTSDKISELQANVNERNQKVKSKCACITEIIKGESIILVGHHCSLVRK